MTLLGCGPRLLPLRLLGGVVLYSRMAQRVPPPAMLELQSNFPTLAIGAFTGDWAAYDFRFLTAISRLPAVASLVSGHLLRPTQRDADAFIFPTVNGFSELSKFKQGSVAYITGCLAISLGVGSKRYGTASSAGEFNNPWNGDTFNFAAGQAGYAAFVRTARAATMVTNPLHQ